MLSGLKYFFVKNCSQCREELPLSSFYPRSDRSSGYTSACKSCRSVPQDRAKKRKQRAYRLKADYGLTVEDYGLMKEAQGGVCAICNKGETSKSKVGKVKNLAVDHCHSSGKIRGLLCENCNKALGLFKDDTSVMKEAIIYLEKL